MKIVEDKFLDCYMVGKIGTMIFVLTERIRFTFDTKLQGLVKEKK